jgi:hypothetical protein
MKVSADIAVHSEHGKVIKHNFKPGSVERSIDLDKGDIPQPRRRSSMQLFVFQTANKH